MRFKGTSALFIVFVALGVFVYFTEFRNREARQQQEEAEKKALQIEDKSISEISLIYPGLTITGKRTGENAWEMTEPAGIEADPEEWNQIAANIARIERDDTVEASASDLKPFGLETPLIRVVTKTTDGKSFEIQFGNENPRKIQNYAKFADSNEVFLTPNSWPRLFQKTVADVRNKKVLLLQSENIDGVRIEEGRNQIELGYNSDQHRSVCESAILRGSGHRFPGGRVECPSDSSHIPRQRSQCRSSAYDRKAVRNG
jgi:hypothetical protein